METQTEYQVKTPKLKIAKYDVNEAAISKMASIYLNLSIEGVEDKKGFEEVHSARMVMVRHRTGIEKLRKVANSSYQAIIKNNNSNASRLIDLMAPIESHLEIEETGITRERERIKRERERVARERIEGHKKGIDYIRTFSIVSPALTADYISSSQKTLSDIDTSEAEFEEFWTEASRVKAETLKYVNKALETRLQWEKEEEERKAEALCLKAVGAAQEEEKKWLLEAQLAAEEERAAARDKLRAEREVLEKEKAKLAAAIEAGKTAKARALQAEKDAIAKKEAEEADRLAQEEADKAEAARQEALKPDKERLLDFAEQIRMLTTTEMTVKDQSAKNVLARVMAVLLDVYGGFKNEIEAL